MSGTLFLIPTPIDEISPLEGMALSLLQKAAAEEHENSLFLIEDLKPGRRRWLRFGLPRESVDKFILFNEHTATDKLCHELISELKLGKNLYLMSDGGLPAFCDPGANLVDLCHQNKVRVTSTPFANSVSLALALSGFSHDRFVFFGFLSRDKEIRKQELGEIKDERRTVILMDTPYRLKRVLEEVQDFGREIFLAMDLGSENEELLRGSARQVISKLKDYKREFILIFKTK